MTDNNNKPELIARNLWLPVSLEKNDSLNIVINTSAMEIPGVGVQQRSIVVLKNPNTQGGLPDFKSNQVSVDVSTIQGGELLEGAKGFYQIVKKTPISEILEAIVLLSPEDRKKALNRLASEFDFKTGEKK